jgi:hypothetical protein
VVRVAVSPVESATLPPPPPPHAASERPKTKTKIRAAARNAGRRRLAECPRSSERAGTTKS